MRHTGLFCRHVEDVNAGVAVVNGDTCGLPSKVDEPRRLPIGSREYFGRHSGCVSVNGPDQRRVEAWKVLGSLRAVPEERVDAFLSHAAFAGVQFFWTWSGGVAVEPAVTDDPKFGGGPDPFGVAEQGFVGAVATERGLPAVRQPLAPFGRAGASEARGVAVSWRAVYGIDH